MPNRHQPKREMAAFATEALESGPEHRRPAPRLSERRPPAWRNTPPSSAYAKRGAKSHDRDMTGNEAILSKNGVTPCTTRSTTQETAWLERQRGNDQIPSEPREACCGRMSSRLMPATTTGLFMASRRKGSPSSWFNRTSMKV